MATKVRSYSKGPRKLIANQPAVHLQLCGDSIAIYPMESYSKKTRRNGGSNFFTTRSTFIQILRFKSAIVFAFMAKVKFKVQVKR